MRCRRYTTESLLSSRHEFVNCSGSRATRHCQRKLFVPALTTHTRPQVQAYETAIAGGGAGMEDVLGARTVAAAAALMGVRMSDLDVHGDWPYGY